VSDPTPVYQLLPAIHRIRDTGQPGQPLAALLAIVDEEWRRLRAEVDQLHDDWFIETCTERVVARLGELLGVPGLAEVPGAGTSHRALVANTLRYRRRKGTASVLSDLARDVTGWPTTAVEYFRLLATTQHLSHIRPGNHGTPDLRDADRLELLGTPRDPVARTADVRHIDRRRGRHNLPNVGLHLWRLTAYQLAGADARAVDAGQGRWTFDPAGRELPLFDRPPGLPAPLRRRALRHQLREPGRPLPVAVVVDGAEVPPARLHCCDLSGWRRPPADPAGVTVSFDPVTGRLTLPAGVEPEQVQVSFGYGFPGDLGAGPYDRRELLPPAGLEPDFQREVARDGESLAAAVAAWNAAPGAAAGVITVRDNASYRDLPEITVPDGCQLWIVAADLRRPHLIGDLVAGGGGRLLVAGLSIEGQIRAAPAGPLAQLRLLGCSTAGLADPAGHLELRRSITGAADLPGATGLELADSIVAGDLVAPRADAEIEAVTVLGTSSVRSVTANNAILLGRLAAALRQHGCVRFSYLPPDSVAPRRYRCQPAGPDRRVVPRFSSLDPAAPGFCQLATDCPPEITGGADDEGEQGAFHLLAQQRRIGNLTTQLDHYLPFGLAAGIWYAT
jgi:hypothetical protein